MEPGESGWDYCCLPIAPDMAECLAGRCTYTTLSLSILNHCVCVSGRQVERDRDHLCGNSKVSLQIPAQGEGAGLQIFPQKKVGHHYTHCLLLLLVSFAVTVAIYCLLLLLQV